jgi:hypothetical protein
MPYDDSLEYLLQVLTDLKEEMKPWTEIVVEDAKPLHDFYNAVCDYFLIGKEFAHFPKCLNIDWEANELKEVFWHIFGKNRRYFMRCMSLDERYNAEHPSNGNRNLDFDIMMQVAESMKHRVIQ